MLEQRINVGKRAGVTMYTQLPSDAAMIAYAPCIRCGTVFGFNPENVNATSVHLETRCCLRPDGSQVEAGDPDTEKVPVCPVCFPIHLLSTHEPVALPTLFPHARFDLIDVEAAKRLSNERQAAK
jgi:hypothetical protein